MFCLCLLAAAGVAGAAAPREIPEATSLLVDETGALTEGERKTLLTRLQAFQDDGRAQIGILVSKGTGGAPLAEYSLRVAEKWKLGRAGRAGRDDGLLILVISSPAAVRIEVGYGLEGYIPDARASQWIAEFSAVAKQDTIAGGLDYLLDRIDGVLPKPAAKPTADERDIFKTHPEWAAPWMLMVSSLFTIMPLVSVRWGGFVSAPILAAILGTAAWLFWRSPVAAGAVAGFAFVLPILWGLNRPGRRGRRPRWLGYLKTFGNLAGILLFFSVITLLVGVPMRFVHPEYVWGAPIFAGLLAVAVAVFAFPKAIRPLMVFLRSAIHFTLILVVVLISLQPFIPHPGQIAFAAASAITALIAVGLYLDSRESARLPPAGSDEGMRASHWVFGLALLIIVPLGLVALILAVGGEDLQTRIMQAAVGGGSIGGILLLAARYGLFAAVKVGLGGRFGGGGAGR